MSAQITAGLLVTVASVIALNWAYVQEHGAAAGLPALSLRQPLHSIQLLLTSRAWLAGLLAEALGFGLYVVALALAPLSLVQTLSAGGIAVLAYLSNQRAGRTATQREKLGVGVALLGLAGLGASLAHGEHNPADAELGTVVLWLAGWAGLASLAITVGRRRLGQGVSYAIASGIGMAAGDVSMKVALEGGERLWLLATGAAGYGFGTIVLQIAYQHAGAVTAAGISALLTNAIPIVAATTILHEGLPNGVFGALRVLAFVAVIGGAVLLARPATKPEPAEAV